MRELSMQALAIVVTFHPNEVVFGNVMALVVQGLKVVVVDNGSKENISSVMVLQALKKIQGVILLQNTVNLGIATALNQGIRYANENEFEMVFTFDQDSQVTEHFVKTMLTDFQQAESTYGPVAFLAPSYIDQASQRHMNTQVRVDANGLGRQSVVMASGNLTRVTVLKKIGHFREDFFIDYVDMEINLRAKVEGFSIVQTVNAFLLHNLGKETRHNIFLKTVTCSNHDYKRRYTITRNRFLLYFRYFRFDRQWVISDARSFVEETIKIVLFEEDKLKKLKSIVFGIKDAFFGKLGAFSYDKTV
jgi:rhamnosyltransferase